ncbi:hypothetical protein NT6N_08040 [Oceaniferula spumae]|uniref:Uncharacterized protein n=1 Tax=Oceaniferula spumae TaxID=2979115 RepID=A0AAT9FIG8_9BACT
MTLTFSQEMLPHAHKADTERFITRYGAGQGFRLAGVDFRWIAFKHDPEINNDSHNRPNSCGAAISVSSEDLGFEVEFPIWTQECATTNPKYLYDDHKVALWDVWHITHGVVYGRHFPGLESPERPLFICLYRGYWGDANLLHTSNVVSLTQKILTPRKRRRRTTFEEAVDWPSQNPKRGEQGAAPNP